VVSTEEDTILPGYGNIGYDAVLYIHVIHANSTCNGKDYSEDEMKKIAGAQFAKTVTAFSAAVAKVDALTSALIACQAKSATCPKEKKSLVDAVWERDSLWSSVNAQDFVGAWPN